MSILTLTDVGPVKSLKLEVPEDGGVVVLRARNGRGKTKTLEAIESAITVSRISTPASNAAPAPIAVCARARRSRVRQIAYRP